MSQVRLLQLDGYDTTMCVRHPLLPSSAPVLMLHGIQSHPGWFADSAELLALKGHTVYQVTRRGSGATTGDRGHARSVGQLMADLDCTADAVCADADADAFHLVGISWGGKMAVRYLLDPLAAERVRSLTLVAPGIVPRVDVPWPTKMAIAACFLAAPRRLFDIPLSDPALFTDNPERRQFIEDDPHRLTQATARFLAVSRIMDRQLARAGDGAIETPTQLILADRDRIIDNERTRAHLERLTGGRLRTTILPGAHTLEFEPDRSALFDVLVDAMAD